MVFHQHIPSQPLGHFIESFTYYKGYNPDHSIDRFLPDGNINIVFDLTDFPKSIYDNDSLEEIQTCRNVWFSGIREKYITIPSGKDNEMFIINFRKGRAYPFVKMPMNELTELIVDGEQVLSPAILELREVLLTHQDVHQKFCSAETYLEKQFLKRLIINPFVEFAVDLIDKNPDQLSMKSLSEKAGYSQKHLIQLFRQHVGVTPKSFLKIIRFQKAIQEMDTKRIANWASLALDCGYYDQAHFIHDFKNFSGFTPAEFLKMNMDFTNYVAIG